jgi:PAS domain S-box-containing protein
MENRLMPSDAWHADPMTFWRERILFLLCSITVIFGVLVLIPSVILALLEKLWFVAFLDVTTYAALFLIWINRGWPLKVRGYAACLIYYLLGCGLLFALGPQSAGHLWFFSASIMAGFILGLEAAIVLLVLNALTMIAMSLFSVFGSPYWSQSLENPFKDMIVITIGYAFLNTFVIVTTGFMLNGLKKALENERNISANLRKNEERYRIVADFNYDWEYWITPDGCVEYMSPSCRKITGYHQDDFMNNPDLLLNIVHEEDRQSYGEHIEDVWENVNRVNSLDFRIVTLDGCVRWINHNCQSVFSDSGIYMGRRVGNRDITERKHVENTLRLHQERFLTVLNSIAASIYVADLNSHEVLFMNKHMIEHHGKDLTGTICWQTLKNGAATCRWCVKDRLTHEDYDENEVYSWQEQHPVSKRWYVYYDRIIKWTDGRPAKIQIATDITDQKKMETDLRQAHKMEAIGTLAGGIAHDFNNILSAIIGFSELAIEEADPGTLLVNNLEEVLIACRRAQDLVRQILAFARRSDERVKPFIVGTVAREALRLLRSSIPATITIKRNITSESAIIGNPTQVHQIFMNLCTNAAHAMERGGGVLNVDVFDVRLEGRSPEEPDLDPGDYLKITISDTGEGIPPEIIDAVFEPYFTTKGSGEGSGMGLAVVQGIVESYGGKIYVESRSGRGTTFSIYLPIAYKRSELTPEPKIDLPRGNEHILLVDDELPIINMGRQALERLGYRVTSRTSSIEALSLFRIKPHEFDLVISDMTMPNMTGDKLAVEMMRIRPDIPVILCTGYSNTITEDQALQIGVKAFIYKPIIKKDLANVIRSVLDQRRLIGSPP